MSLPPERLHVKRRRNDEPVDLLCLEESRPQKRHSNNDFLFARVQSPVSITETQTKAKGPEIPTVKATAPGDEVKDEIARQAAQKALREKYQVKKEDLPTRSTEDKDSKTNLQTLKNLLDGRPRRVFRFQRNHAKPHTNKHYGGIQKRTRETRKMLATFAETSERCTTPELDAMVNIKRNDDNSNFRAPEEDSRVGLSVENSSRSQNDETSHENGQLPETATKTENGDVSDDEFVYDTFVRVPNDEQPLKETIQVGTLVIESEDQDQWDLYAESDSDDNWDEEDPDSNAEDNPANDYPDEELSDDDEYGTSAYRHRHYGSDDEEYDLERSYSNEE